MGSNLSDAEKQGLVHFFKSRSNMDLLHQLVKSITKNALSFSNNEEALKIILLHNSSIYGLLNKRMFTKEILLKYLTENNVTVATEMTKMNLIERIIEFWDCLSIEKEEMALATAAISHLNEQSQDYLSSANSSQEVAISVLDRNVVTEETLMSLAKEFSTWFFTKMNSQQLRPEDLWIDVSLQIKITALNWTSGVNNSSSKEVVDCLYEIQNRYNFFYNPNVGPEGLRAKTESHGLVLVLSCGTLHENEKCIGTFESAFGLMRDPFQNNNWKIKSIQMLLKSNLTYNYPMLTQNDSKDFDPSSSSSATSLF